MKNFSEHRRYKEKGIALFIALSVMVIFLIMCLGIVNLTTGNLKTVGNISSRLQALNIANAASMYGIYEIRNGTNPGGNTWGPGPTPVANSLIFTEYDHSELSSHLNGMPGKCKLAYVNNLNNPNNVSLSVPSMFSSSSTSVEVYGETAIVIAQGEYEGFKRTVKTTIKYNYYGSSADIKIKLGDGAVRLNGVRDIRTLEPIAGSLYSGKSINYNNVSGYKFLNGSILISHGSISQDTPATGETIDSRFIEANQSESANVGDWNINDNNFTGFDPGDSDTFLTVPGLAQENIEPNTSVEKPVNFPAPTISCDNRYYDNGDIVLNKDATYPEKPYFVNGNLRLGNLTLNDATLVVNGTLTIDKSISVSSKGRIIVAGYYNDPAHDASDPNNPFGLSLHLKDIGDNKGLSMTNSQGVSVITEGDVKIGNNTGTMSSQSNQWLTAMPEDIMKLKNTFEMLGISKSTDQEAEDWFTDHATHGHHGWGGHGSSIYPISIEGFTGEEILKGEANEELISIGLKSVPSEVSTWFNSSYSEGGFKFFSSDSEHWDTFKVNPSLFQTSSDCFLQAVIYTHGMVTTSDSNKPVRIVGGVVSKYNALYSPNPTPLDPNASHGGVVYLTDNSSVILYPEGFKSNKPVVKSTLTVYEWEEL